MLDKLAHVLYILEYSGNTVTDVRGRSFQSGGTTMRAWQVIASVLVAGVSFAGPKDALPSGKYTGSADWKGPGGSSGTYTVEKTFDGTSVVASYTWSDDKKAHDERHTVTFVTNGPGPQFDVTDDKGQKIGQGYCYDDACSYRATFGPVTVDETFRWSGREMTVLGAKSGPGFSVVWKETLELE